MATAVTVLYLQDHRTATTAVIPDPITPIKPAPASVSLPQPIPDFESERSMDPADAPSPIVFRRSENVRLPSVEGDRLPVARARAEQTVRALFTAAGLAYPPERLFLRAFKRERELELWAAPALGGFRHIATYEIAGTSGGPGPKRREGDGQTPEGFYQIDRFNPKSSFHLSLGINYPNASDRILSDKDKPGYDIFLHGRDSSIGCLALGDDRIEEVFVAATDTKDRPIAVHVFPGRMNAPDWESWRDVQTAERPDLLAFWENLRPGWEIFERTHLLPNISVRADGRYECAGSGLASIQDLRQ